MATVNLRIGPADNGRRMTLEEFREAEEQPGHLYELARGVLEVTEVPGDDQGQIVDNLHEAISDYNRKHPGLIRRIGHGSDIRLIIPELESDRHPDLAVVFRNFTRMYRDRQRRTWWSRSSRTADERSSAITRRNVKNTSSWGSRILDR